MYRKLLLYSFMLIIPKYWKYIYLPLESFWWNQLSGGLRDPKTHKRQKKFLVWILGYNCFYLFTNQSMSLYKVSTQCINTTNWWGLSRHGLHSFSNSLRGGVGCRGCITNKCNPWMKLICVELCRMCTEFVLNVPARKPYRCAFLVSRIRDLNEEKMIVVVGSLLSVINIFFCVR